MLPQAVRRFRRPLTPILEGWGAPSEPSTDQDCTFDPGCSLSTPGPWVIQEQVTSLANTDHVTRCPTNHHLSYVQEAVNAIRRTPREEEGSIVLDKLCDLYSHTRHAIDCIEKELINIKQQLRQASEEYIARHERATSATSRHRLTKGLRGVADEKVSMWRDHCRNYELGYIQDRPELEQLKIVYSILKSSITELVESNKYLTSFVEVLQQRRIKLNEQQYQEQIEKDPESSDSHICRQQFEDAMRNQQQVRKFGNPSLREHLKYVDLIKKFGRSMPRPPFAPLNVFKLQALSSHLGKSSLQYGHGQACTLKEDIDKDPIGDEGTYGRSSLEARETWVLTGKNCLKKNSVIGDSTFPSGMMRFGILPSIGSDSIVEHPKLWFPRKSFVKRVSSTDVGFLVQSGNRRLKQTSTSERLMKEEWRKPKRKKGSRRLSSSRLTLNKWGNNSDTDLEDSARENISHERTGTEGHFVTHHGKSHW